jgi:hypothetical protein
MHKHLAEAGAVTTTNKMGYEDCNIPQAKKVLIWVDFTHHKKWALLTK